MISKEPVFRIGTTEGDIWNVALSLYDASLVESVCSEITQQGVEVYNILLDRVEGKSVMPPSVRDRIAGLLAGFMQQRDNAILTYVCDTSDVARRDMTKLPQQFRSELFGCMFKRYCTVHGDCRICDNPICFVHTNEDGTKEPPIYGHILYHSEHRKLANLLEGLLMQDK